MNLIRDEPSPHTDGISVSTPPPGPGLRPRAAQVGFDALILCWLTSCLDVPTPRSTWVKNESFETLDESETQELLSSALTRGFIGVAKVRELSATGSRQAAATFVD